MGSYYSILHDFKMMATHSCKSMVHFDTIEWYSVPFGCMRDIVDLSIKFCQG
jgi:hypothetical protein